MSQPEKAGQPSPESPYWRQMAWHGRVIAGYTLFCGFFLLGLVKRIEFSGVTFPTYFGYLVYLALMSVVAGLIGSIVGSGIGAVVGLTQPKPDVAKAVTATVALIVCIALLAWAALFTRLIYS